jgi:hypothetical protein
MDFDTHPTDTEPSTTVSTSLYGPYVGRKSLSTSSTSFRRTLTPPRK